MQYTIALGPTRLKIYVKGTAHRATLCTRSTCSSSIIRRTTYIILTWNAPKEAIEDKIIPSSSDYEKNETTWMAKEKWRAKKNNKESVWVEYDGMSQLLLRQATKSKSSVCACTLWVCHSCAFTQFPQAFHDFLFFHGFPVHLHSSGPLIFICFFWFQSIPRLERCAWTHAFCAFNNSPKKLGLPFHH